MTCDAPNPPANGSFVLVKRLQTSSSTTPLSLDSIEDYANGDGSGVATAFNPVVAGYAVGDRIQFTCLPSFRLDGPSSLSCLDEGQWEDVMPICQPLACTHIPYVENDVVANGVGAGGIGDLGESGGHSSAVSATNLNRRVKCNAITRVSEWDALRSVFLSVADQRRK